MFIDSDLVNIRGKVFRIVTVFPHNLAKAIAVHELDETLNLFGSDTKFEGTRRLLFLNTGWQNIDGLCPPGVVPVDQLADSRYLSADKMMLAGLAILVVRYQVADRWE